MRVSIIEFIEIIRLKKGCKHLSFDILAIFDENFDIKKLRYDKIIILTESAV